MRKVKRQRKGKKTEAKNKPIIRQHQPGFTFKLKNPAMGPTMDEIMAERPYTTPVPGEPWRSIRADIDSAGSYEMPFERVTYRVSTDLEFADGEPIITTMDVMGFTVEPGPDTTVIPAGTLVTTNRNGNVVPVEDGDAPIGTWNEDGTITLTGNNIRFQSVSLVANPVDPATQLEDYDLPSVNHIRQDLDDALDNGALGADPPAEMFEQHMFTAGDHDDLRNERNTARVFYADGVNDLRIEELERRRVSVNRRYHAPDIMHNNDIEPNGWTYAQDEQNTTEASEE